MASTIKNNVSVGISLTSAYTNPVVVNPEVTVINPGYPNAVYTGPGATYSFSIENNGSLVGSGTTVAAGTDAGAKGSGVYLAAAGSVTNATSGLISGYVGVKFGRSAGTVDNFGTILGDTIAGAPVVGGGPTMAAGVSLAAGGTVTNAQGALIAGYQGAVISNATIINSGTVENTNVHSVYAAVDALNGAVVDNRLSGLISGGLFGVYVGGSGIVTNYGTIQTGGYPAGYAVRLDASSASSTFLTNAQSGTIIGHGGIQLIGIGTIKVVNSGTIDVTGPGRGIGGENGPEYITNAPSGVIIATSNAAITDGSAHPSQVINYGRITSPNAVIESDGTVLIKNSGTLLSSGPRTVDFYWGASGTILNFGSIVAGSGGTAISFSGNSSSGTILNSGSIVAGSGGTAISFAGTLGNLLKLQPGFFFSGLVSGSSSSVNQIELASAAVTGTITGLGVQFQRFNTIQFDAGAQWYVSGLPRGLSGPITGFAYGDTIELQGVTATGSSFSGGVLTLQEEGGSATLNLPGTFTISDFIVANGTNGADVTLACFVAGTRILTSTGEVPVEELSVGDRVATLQGRGPAPIVWLGHRHVDCHRHSRKEDVLPVRVRAGALGEGRPHRDLLLSPDHAVSVDGVLIPVRYLINGTTIAQKTVAEITYYHVELAVHDVVLAEGLPCESYLETGNRAAFTTAVGALESPPVVRVAT